MKNKGMKEIKQEMEICVGCRDETNVPIDLHIDFRAYYIEGAGQLCKKCYNKIYNKKCAE